MTAETRNHLVAAIQNLKVAHKYLAPIQVPYYSEKDIQVQDKGKLFSELTL